MTERSEQRLAEALRAQVAGGGWAGLPGSKSGGRRRQLVVALGLALAVGLLLGVGLALVSVLVPGLLPPLG